MAQSGVVWGDAVLGGGIVLMLPDQAIQPTLANNLPLVRDCGQVLEC